MRVTSGSIRAVASSGSSSTSGKRWRSVRSKPGTLLRGPPLIESLARLQTGELSAAEVRHCRGGIRGPEPSPETKLGAGDVLVLYGAPEALEEAEKVLLEG